MTADVIDCFWALLGSGVHKVLELGNEDRTNVRTEERLYATVHGWEISAQLDQQTDRHTDSGRDVTDIMDYKVTSVWAVLNEKIEWEYQLNVQAFLVRESRKRDIGKLQICAVIRDWERSRAAWDRDYPDYPIVVINVPLWKPFIAKQWVEKRVQMHQLAGMADTQDELPLCTDDERWIRDEKWKVRKLDAKRAYRSFDTEADANRFWLGLKEDDKKQYEVVRAPGKPIRCEGDYCSVAKWCQQYQKEINDES